MRLKTWGNVELACWTTIIAVQWLVYTNACQRRWEMLIPGIGISWNHQHSVIHTCLPGCYQPLINFMYHFAFSDNSYLNSILSIKFFLIFHIFDWWVFFHEISRLNKDLGFWSLPKIKKYVSSNKINNKKWKND